MDHRARAPVRPPQPRVRARLGRSTVQSGRSDAYHCGSGSGSSYSCTVCAAAAHRSMHREFYRMVTVTRSTEKRAKSRPFICTRQGRKPAKAVFPLAVLSPQNEAGLDSNRNPRCRISRRPRARRTAKKSHSSAFHRIWRYRYLRRHALCSRRPPLALSSARIRSPAEVSPPALLVRRLRSARMPK